MREPLGELKESTKACIKSRLHVTDAAIKGKRIHSGRTLEVPILIKVNQQQVWS